MGRRRPRRGADDHERQVVTTMRFSDADEPWPTSESGPSRDDDLYRHGVRLSDPGGLDRFRRQQLELKAERAAYQERQQAEQSERWMRGHLERDWTRRRDEVAKMIDGEREHMLEVIGMAFSEERGRHRAELTKLETRIAALEQQRGATAGQVHQLPALPSPRKRDPDAA
jgi:hypothetical protein